MSADIDESGNGICSGHTYSEVQQFYARHMHLLDSGATDEWAATFSRSGSFTVPTAPDPVVGRAAIAEALAASVRKLQDAGERHRHWHGMIDVRVRPDGGLDVRCYALVFASSRGEGSRLHRVCVCRDVLVREEGELRVATRVVTRDDLP
ncbi:nuclear transport factor 2 family protein [Amycolatopsis sp. NPDC003676]